MQYCATEGCGNPHYGKGLCRTHYHRQYRPPRRPKGWRPPPTEVRFWLQVDRTGPCWLWKSRVNRGGYGVFSHDGTTSLAHRYSWVLCVGPIPEGRQVCHNCPGGDNKRCVNPGHLFLGTAAEHGADRRQKGQPATGDRNGSRLHPERLRRGDTHPKKSGKGVMYGEKNPKAKLTEAQVAEIRARYVPRKVTHSQLATEYGVSTSLVQKILLGLFWQHPAATT